MLLTHLHVMKLRIGQMLRRKLLLSSRMMFQNNSWFTDTRARFVQAVFSRTPCTHSLFIQQHLEDQTWFIGLSSVHITLQHLQLTNSGLTWFSSGCVKCRYDCSDERCYFYKSSQHQLKHVSSASLSCKKCGLSQSQKCVPQQQHTIHPLQTTNVGGEH